MSYNLVIAPQIKVALQELMSLFEKLHDPVKSKGQLKDLGAKIRAKIQVIDGLKKQLVQTDIKKVSFNEASWQKLQTSYTTVENNIRDFEERLNTAGDLQTVLQKEQKNLQKMSSMSKTLSEHAMAIIKKIG